MWKCSGIQNVLPLITIVHIWKPTRRQRRPRRSNDLPSTITRLKLPRNASQRRSTSTSTHVVRIQTHLSRILHLRPDRQKRLPLQHHCPPRFRIPLRKLPMEPHVHKRTRLVLQPRIRLLQRSSAGTGLDTTEQHYRKNNYKPF